MLDHEGNTLVSTGNTSASTGNTLASTRKAVTFLGNDLAAEGIAEPESNVLASTAQLPV